MKNAKIMQLGLILKSVHLVRKCRLEQPVCLVLIDFRNLHPVVHNPGDSCLEFTIIPHS